MPGMWFWHWKSYVYHSDKDVGVGGKYVAEELFLLMLIPMA